MRTRDDRRSTAAAARGFRRGHIRTRLITSYARLAASGLLTASVLLGSTRGALAQPFPHETGRLPIRTFSHRDFGADPYVWYAAQGKGGLMYFANLNGVLEFDGRTWRKIRSGGTVVRSLAADTSGTIFVGSHGNLGVLRPDSAGLLRFVSLRDQIPEADRNFDDVWETVVTTRGVYFDTPTHIFRWSPDDGMHVWRGSFHNAFAVRDTVYVLDWERGLVRLDERGTIPVPGGERFTDLAITAMLPYDDDRILIATYLGDLFLFDGASFTPFITEADAYLHTHLPFYYAFARLPDGSFALGTQSGGVVLIDHDGRLLRIADRTTGLQSNKVYYIHVDHEGGLWLTHENGITRWEPRSPLSYFDESSGITGNVEAFLRHDGRLYAAGSSGIFVLREAENPGRPAHFDALGDEQEQCWDLAAVGPRLLAACTHGVFEVFGGMVKRVLETESAAFTLHASTQEAGLLYVGLKDGLTRIRLADGRWTNAGRLEGIQLEVRSMLEEPDGRLWIGGSNAALLVDPEKTPDPVIRRFGREDGLSRGYVTVLRIGSDVLLGAENGLWRPSDRGDSLRRIPIVTDPPMRKIQAADSRSIWMLSSEGMRPSRIPGMLQIDDAGTYHWHPLSMLEDWNAGAIYPESDGVVWLSGPEGVARYDPTEIDTAEIPFDAFVRRVATIRSDSVVFGGARGASTLRATLPYAENSIRFSVGAASFDRRPPEPAAQQFQYLLQGFDTGWSRWTDEIRKDYTNLPEGDYAFQVRARSADGRLSRTAALSFSILPPWYRTPWAYAGYALLVIGMLYAGLRWRTAHLAQRNRMLEKQVAQRSAQLVRQNDELEAANARLAEHEQALESRNAMLEHQTEKLRELDAVKSRFFANISHEFRTPLTLILGPLDDAMNDADGSGALAQYVEPMHRNASNLLRFINELLDFAKLESGRMSLRVRRMDVRTCITNTVAAFSSRAARRNIELQIALPEKPLILYADEEKLERIVSNLISNAFKFTPKGGSIRVACELDDADSAISISVEDTGSGIPPDRLERIFDRFYTSDDLSNGSRGGTGIGLALARELVQLHGGRIAVESEPGSGTRLTIHLPTGDGHFEAGDIMPAEESPSEAPLSGVPAPLTSESFHPTETPEDPAPQQKNARQQPAATKDASILIVEDNPDLRAYLRGHLEHDYRIEEAEDGIVGLERARTERPDLIISDVMMPRMDGYALCKAIKSDPDLNHIPIVLLTARASEEDKLEGLELGADDYLSKPFNRNELRIRVENLIEIRRLLRSRFSREVIAVRASEVEIKSEDAILIETATSIVEANVRNSNFGVDWLASEVDMSVRQLERKLKELTGLSPGGFIRSIRLQRAAQLLENGFGNVAEVAAEVGYSDPKYFSKLFRQVFGTTPSSYRQA